MRRRTLKHEQRVAKRAQRDRALNRKDGERACSVCRAIFVSQDDLNHHVPCQAQQGEA